MKTRHKTNKVRTGKIRTKNVGKMKPKTKPWHELEQMLKDELMKELEHFCSKSGSLSELCQKLTQFSSPQKSVTNEQKSVINEQESGINEQESGINEQESGINEQESPHTDGGALWKKGNCLGKMVFTTSDAFERFLLVGKYPQHSSPCVDYQFNEVVQPEHSLVYEEWQKHSSREDNLTNRRTVFYRCRRSRVPGAQKRKSPKEPVGCACKAKLTAAFNVNGSVTVTFRGKHNHCTQGGKAFEYVNAIKVCRQIRDMVDEKLYAGINKTGKIRYVTPHNSYLIQLPNSYPNIVT